MNCFPTLGLTLAVSKALRVGGDFRWGCGRTKAAGGVVSVEPLQEEGEMWWSKEGDPCLQNHLVVKNNQCLTLPVASSYRMLLEETMSFWHLFLTKCELYPPSHGSRPLWEAPAVLKMGHSGGITRSSRSPWDAGVEESV